MTKFVPIAAANRPMAMCMRMPAAVWEGVVRS